MKISLFLLALLVTGTTGFAQSTSTAEVETALSQFLTEYNQSPYDFFKKRSTDDFRYIDRQGAFVLKPALLKSSEGRPGLQSSTSDLKILRSGDLAVVSGIQSFSENVKTAFTYTLKKEGQGTGSEWKFAASQHTPILAQPALENRSEEDAVRKVIETETRAFHEAKPDLLVAQWSDKPYAERQQANLKAPTGAPFLKGDNLRSFGDSYFKTLKASGHTVRLTDYDVHISGATAWATYTQEELDGAGKVVNKEREIRVLERETAGWKIAFMGFQDMN